MYAMRSFFRQSVSLSSVVVVERVAKSRVSNRSDSKKSDSGRVGIPKSQIRVPKKSDSGTQKVGYFVGLLFTFYSKFYVLVRKVRFG